MSSTLNADQIAAPLQRIIFTCITRGSDILEWASEEYIGSGGARLQLLSIDCVERNEMSRINPNTTATCVSVSQTGDGTTVIVSQLMITASIDHPLATVACSNNGHGSRENITFQIIGKYTSYGDHQFVPTD